MSTRTSKASASAAGQAALAFPILIRLPDLRAGKSKPGAVAAPASATTTPEPETAPAKRALLEQSPTDSVLAAPAVESLAEVVTNPIFSTEVPTEPTLVHEIVANSAAAPTIASESVAPIFEAAAVVPSKPQIADEARQLPEIVAPSVTLSEAQVIEEQPAESSASLESSGVANELAKTEEPGTAPNATSVAQTDGISPAAARRQRAQERARRQPVARAAPPRTWRSSHLPVIAVGFLVALIITVYIARSNRETRSAQASPEVDVPLLDIDMGNSSDSPSASNPAPAMFAAEPSAVSTPEFKSLSKSPPLLSATSPPVDRANDAGSAETHAAAKPVDAEERAGVANEHFNERSTSESTGNEPASSTTTELAVESDYPSTPATVHRPGGRVPRTARTLTYPQTSTPHLR